MKLYATTTSERASKGQGGNKYLAIIISGENNVPLWKVLVRHSQTEDAPYYDLQVDNVTRKFDGYKSVIAERSLPKTKGNKQKGEKYCTSCGFVEAQDGEYCTKCGIKMTYRI